ncbi:hypothetical protein [Kitasatospora purpeofusca]|uniref:hypothetical protein n=1 Tax=Kitasatospora purpeofusca TaxID=67352 RepID=UPI003864D214|nr:hypothetical protein OIP63_01400 [Kitasatospora purpeofusca]
MRLRGIPVLQDGEDVKNRTSVDYNAAVMAGLPRLYSWDVTGLNPIVPKAGALAIDRPDASGPGFSALIATTIATLDFARSSRGVSPGNPKPYSFVPFAKDAVSSSAKAAGHALADLRGAQLSAIYECTATNWLQIDPSLANATVKPYLPPPSSGTRVAFLKALGGGTAIVPGACVTAGHPARPTSPVRRPADRAARIAPPCPRHRNAPVRRPFVVLVNLERRALTRRGECCPARWPPRASAATGDDDRRIHCGHCG